MTVTVEPDLDPGGIVHRHFGDLGPEVVEVIEERGGRVAAPAGTVLMQQGDPADHLLLILEGTADVVVVHDDHDELVATVGPGETLGETALLSSEPRSATVRTATDAHLIRLTRDDFEHVLATHPETATAVARLVTSRLNARLQARGLAENARRMPLVTAQECDEIVHTECLVLRNLRITQMYHRLALEITRMTGPLDTNWCNYGCKASKTAGYSIRREELPMYRAIEALRPHLAQRFDRVADRVARSELGRRVDSALGAVSDTISAGNLKVFAELAPVFAEMVRTFHADRRPQQAKLDRFLGELAPGPTEEGGQQTLADAVRCYYEAMFEDDPKRRAELILLANVRVGLHEQIRLQPHIKEALDAPARIGLDGLITERVDRRVGRLLHTRFGELVHDAAEHEEEVLVRLVVAWWRRQVTRKLMTLRLPYGVIRIGDDVPELPDTSMYPDVLQTLTHPELVEFADEWDRCPTTGRTRAADWANLRDRMVFIFELMRSRQRSLELFSPPFLEEQRAAIVEGVLPGGPL